MGTVPEPEPQPEPKVTIVRRHAETAVRILIAGHEVGAIRRIALYAVVAATLFAAGPVGVVGLVALVLLATTDDLR